MTLAASPRSSAQCAAHQWAMTPISSDDWSRAICSRLARLSAGRPVQPSLDQVNPRSQIPGPLPDQYSEPNVGSSGPTIYGEANNVFTRRERADDDPAWISYVVALP